MKNLFISLATACYFLLPTAAQADDPRDVRKLLDTNVCVRCDLSFADFRGVDLTGADLRGVDFRGADLRDASFEDADLRGADLRGADYRGADFTNALFDSAISSSIRTNRTAGTSSTAR